MGLKPRVLEFQISNAHAGARLDKFLRKKLANVPVSHLFKMIRVKKVRVNGKRAQAEQPLALGDVVFIRGDEKQLIGASPARVPPPPPPVNLEELHVLHEDDWIL